MKTTLVFVAYLFCNQFASAVQYLVTKLGTIGNIMGQAYSSDINNTGQISGFFSSKSDVESNHAFSYSNEVMSDIGKLGGISSRATGINDKGQLTGVFNVTRTVSHSFLYSEGIMQDIGTLGGLNSYSTGINNSAQICGYSNVSNGYYNNAFLYSNGMMQNLGTLGGSSSGASGINNLGQVVGYSYVTGDTSAHSFLYSNGVMQDLGTLNGEYWNDARAINDSGQIAGYGSVGGFIHAYLRSENGVTIDLGTLGGPESESGALSINNKGWIVGFTRESVSAQERAFVYFDGSMKNLNNLIDPNSGITLIGANGINDDGQIVAYGISSADGPYTRSFLLTPIPEPTSICFLFLNSLIFLYRRR